MSTGEARARAADIARDHDENFPVAFMLAPRDVREDITLEGALTYSSRESGFPLADFEGWGAELRLIWRFGARN